VRRVDPARLHRRMIKADHAVYTLGFRPNQT
jgi:hypothetical protein